MVRVIMGLKGAGKTKQMIDIINAAAQSENGNVVCIERGAKLTYDVHSKTRLVEANDYPLDSLETLKGFISGLYAGNYDITHIFIDSLARVVPLDATDPNIEFFLDWVSRFASANSIKFTITISGDPELVSDGVSKFF